MAQLYQSLGDEGKARAILQSVHNGLNKLDTSSEVERNESDKENMITMSTSMMSTTTIRSKESNKENELSLSL
jgi:hypothetical protein